MKQSIPSILSQFLLAFILLASANPAFTQTLSKTTITYNGEVEAAVTDLKTILGKYQAGEIIIRQTKLENRTGQEFYLSVKGNKTEILYTTTNSLENAIYSYLGILGFRWYGPTELWQIQPSKIARKDIAGKWYKPSFRNRQFFGTGGLDFATNPEYDPTNKYKEEWISFKRRNRFNADFVSGGHMGTNFYLDNKEWLDKQQDWFSTEQGKKKRAFEDRKEERCRVV